MICTVLVIIVGFQVSSQFRESAIQYVYIDECGNPVESPTQYLTLVLDSVTPETVSVHFEESIDPHNFAVGEHVWDSMKSVYSRDGEYISGCNRYNVTKAAIDRLLSWRLIG